MAARQEARAGKQEELGSSVSWEGRDTWPEVPRDTRMKAGAGAGWDLEKEGQQGQETRPQGS